MHDELKKWNLFIVHYVVFLSLKKVDEKVLRHGKYHKGQRFIIKGMRWKVGNEQKNDINRILIFQSYLDLDYFRLCTFLLILVWNAPPIEAPLNNPTLT